MDIKVSVIVPVYNVGKYVANCLDSILSQTLHEFEIICVNDGSTDESLSVIEHYEKFDGRVKVINCEHRGLGAARNTGLAAAAGEYVYFVNADDYISSLALNSLYKNAVKNDADVVLYDFVWRNPAEPQEFTKTTIKEFKNYYKDAPFSAEKMGSLSFKLIPVNTWAKLYKTELIKDKIAFDEDTPYCELPFWTKVYASAQRITYVKEPLYFYNIRTGDTISAIHDERCFDIVKAYKRAEQTLKDHNLWKTYKDSLYALMMPEMLHKYNILPHNLKEEFFNLIKSMEKDINYKVYDCDTYNDMERACAKQFEQLQKSDHQTFWNALVGGKN